MFVACSLLFVVWCGLLVVSFCLLVVGCSLVCGWLCVVRGLWSLFVARCAVRCSLRVVVVCCLLCDC